MDEKLEKVAGKIVEEIIFDISDRSGLQNVWEEIDEDIIEEIIEKWENIVLNNIKEL